MTSLVAETFTPSSIEVVAFGVPDVTGNCKGTALTKSLAVTDPSELTGKVKRYCPDESVTYLSLLTLNEPLRV